MEIKAIIMLSLAITFVVFAGLMIAGFYFTITNPSGQGFLMGGFENFATAFYNFVSSPFVALYKIIIGIPAKLGF